ncbi:MAG: M3 family oligoendopeptidase [Candidatus Paceibacterota bacterium]
MKIKTAWNLKLLYKSGDDPQIEKDLREIEQRCETFEKKYRGKNSMASPKKLATAYDDIEKLDTRLSQLEPAWYFALKTDLDSADSQSRALATKYGQRMTEAFNRIKFFGLEIAKIDPKRQRAFLAYTPLKPHVYALTRIFKQAKFNLPEGEEQLKSLLKQTSYSMWIDVQGKLLSQQTIKHHDKDLPIAEAIAKISDSSKRDRREIHNKVNAVLKSISHVAEGEINAVYSYKKVMDKRRGYEKPYSSTILGYENDEHAIENFVTLISKNFKIAHRFYKLHTKLLGEKKITLADRSAQIGEIKTKFDFPASVSILQSTLNKIDPEYATLFENFLTNGQIDVYPKKGKKGGAYCWGSGRLPTFLLLNHTDDLRSLETLAHEMGHAIHTELSKSQPPAYQGHSIATAEVASTFFEQIISAEVEKHLSPKEKVFLLHNKIMGDISTIFRQIACFNFELELHQKIRAAGQISKEEMANLMSKHLKSYLGEAVEVTPDDGYFFVYWPHIRNFFYVYTYAYGQLISRALYEKWQADPSYAKKIKQFLSAGRSMSPEDIFKSIGIDTSKPAFFEAGLKGIERDIIELERLTRS